MPYVGWRHRPDRGQGAGSRDGDPWTPRHRSNRTGAKDLRGSRTLCAPAVEGVVTQLRTIAESPDEIHVEFGLDLHAEAGAFIAAASTTTNFTVAVTWNRKEPLPTTG
ncbi:CU044_2847 family protein [Streptomyces wedmorensis]|uniref:CU044_2847 family protein n=1 Tax=Streptomyces wedmorensis TaxID=43759 RepID=UPI0037A44276